jgi:microcystin-dependent protein
MFAQSAFNYQAIIRDAADNLVKMQTVSTKISIYQGNVENVPVYVETHSGATNINGLLSFEIGKGDALEGVFADIAWGDGDFFIKVETDIDGGTNYSLSAVSKLSSVPHAIVADKALFAENIVEKDEIAMSKIDSINSTYQVSDRQAGDMLYYNGNCWVAKSLTVANAGGGQPFSNMQPFLTLNWCIALVGTFPSRSSNDPFIGELACFGFTFNPSNWAYCNGQLISISSNTPLFSLLGTTYGGDGRSTFALPDLRGRVPLGMGQGSGLSSRNIGEWGGTETVTITVDNMPAHSHTIVYE